MSNRDSQKSARVPRWRDYVNGVVAAELTSLCRYYDSLIQWLPLEHDSGLIYEKIQCVEKRWIDRGAEFPDLSSQENSRTSVLINGSFNHEEDVQERLSELKPKLARTSRVLLVLYNPYLQWLYMLANYLGIRKGPLPGTFLTRVSLQKLAELSGFRIVRQRNSLYLPFALLGLGTLINRVLPAIPILRRLSFTDIVVLRPIVPTRVSGLSCVIPARNEKGNIEDALLRLPELSLDVEIIFVEGNSTDGTWEEIQRVARVYRDRFQIKTLQQAGKGKADAVRLGFEHASQPLLTILDADLTMPPEMLGRFCDAFCNAHGDFVNGSRLVYPMEKEAMRFLNRLGNVFFAKALSWILGVPLSDTLCGTKLMMRHDYQRMVAWRKDFGDIDPFGDFELLFPAATLALDVIDLPLTYRARQYGSTNIQRFSHGLGLLKMALVGFWKIKLAPPPS